VAVKIKKIFSFRKSNSQLTVYFIITSVFLFSSLGVYIYKIQNNEYFIIPEYKRTLKKVVFSLNVNHTDLNLQHNLLSVLPQYTKIFFLVPEKNLKNILSGLKGMAYEKKAQFISYKVRNIMHPQLLLHNNTTDDLTLVSVDSSLDIPQGSNWTQDLYEVLTNSKGRKKIYISTINKGYYLLEKKNFIPDNAYVKNLSSLGFIVKQSTCFFEGGNVLVGEIKGKKIAFVGSDSIKGTMAVRKYMVKQILPYPDIETILLKALGVDDLIIIGNPGHPQPTRMFHLDQGMIFLDDGIVGLSNIVGKLPKFSDELKLLKESELFLSEAKSTLIALGFKVINIDMTVQNLLNYQHYVNTIPYINIETGQKTIFMPVFSSKPSINDKNIILKNTKSFQSIGYKVIEVPVTSSELKGGLHCLINVIE